MRRAPFNACDYLCDRCGETGRCQIYALLRSKALSRRMKGKHDSLHDASIEDVKESLDETMEVLKAIAAVLTIETDEGAGFGSLDKRSVDDDALYRLAQAFTAKTHAFLKTVEPFVKPVHKTAFEDLVWYHRMVSVKTRRAVASDYSGMSEDAVDSAGVAMRSLNRCIEAFEDIRRSCFPASYDSRRLSNTAAEIRRQLRKRFPKDAASEDRRG